MTILGDYKKGAHRKIPPEIRKAIKEVYQSYKQVKGLCYFKRVKRTIIAHVTATASRLAPLH
jgi:hypothetical protein